MLNPVAITLELESAKEHCLVDICSIANSTIIYIRVAEIVRE